MLEREALEYAIDVMKADDFYKYSNQRMFEAMQRMCRKNMTVDLLTVCQELSESGDLESVGGAYAVTKLTSSVVSGAHIESWCNIVKAKAALRNIIRLCANIYEYAYKGDADPELLLKEMDAGISSISDGASDMSMKHISDSLKETIERVQYWRTLESNITGVPSGFSGLDEATRGWQNGDLIIIGARPSVGKTAFALNLVRNAALSGRGVGVWSLEMKSAFLGLRMLSAESGVMMAKLQTGNIGDTEMMDLVVTHASNLSRLQIYFDDGMSVTLSKLAAKARRLKKKNNLGLIVIDYVQLMTGDVSSNNREQEVAKISRGLKSLAVELDVPVIALSQLSRENGGKQIRWAYGPPANALRETGALEQDADVIIMLWGASDDEIADDTSLMYKRRARIVKQRNGVLLTEDLNFRTAIQRFESNDDASSDSEGWREVNF